MFGGLGLKIAVLYLLALSPTSLKNSKCYRHGDKIFEAVSATAVKIQNSESEFMNPRKKEFQPLRLEQQKVCQTLKDSDIRLPVLRILNTSVPDP
jgi:hypothetical protein